MRRGARQMLSALCSRLLPRCLCVAEPLPALGADLARTTVVRAVLRRLYGRPVPDRLFQSRHRRRDHRRRPFGCARTPGTELNPFWPVVLSLNATRAQNQCMQDGWFFSTVPDPADLLNTPSGSRRKTAGSIPRRAGDRQDLLFSSSEDDTVEHGVVEARCRLLPQGRRAGCQYQSSRRTTRPRMPSSSRRAMSLRHRRAALSQRLRLRSGKAILEEFYGPLQARPAVVEANFLRFEQAPFLVRPDRQQFRREGHRLYPHELPRRVRLRGAHRLSRLPARARRGRGAVRQRLRL